MKIVQDGLTMGQRLRKLRSRRKLTVSEVARTMKVAESTYREWENGRMIKGEPYAELAKVFGVGLVELFTGAPAQPALVDDLDEVEGILRRMRTKL